MVGLVSKGGQAYFSGFFLILEKGMLKKGADHIDDSAMDVICPNMRRATVDQRFISLIMYVGT